MRARLCLQFFLYLSVKKKNKILPGNSYETVYCKLMLICKPALVFTTGGGVAI